MFFSGINHTDLAKEITRNLNVDLGKMDSSTFSCGEKYVKVDETIRGKDIYLLQSAGENVNDEVMELLIMLDTFKRASAKSVNVILPHYPYSRQDKKSEPREPISARLIADLLETVGIDRLIAVDLHSDQVQGFFNKPVDHLTAMPLFVDYFLKKGLEDLVVVAPDTGRAKFAKKMADKLGADLAIMHKRRPQHNVAEVVHVVGDVKDKTVLLIDDMVDTGGSITAGIDTLKSFGCNNDIYLACTHAIFSGSCVERLKKANFKEVVITDTVPIPTFKRFEGLVTLSIASLIAEVVKRNVEHRSISSLFD